MAVPSGSAQVVSQPTSSGRLLRLLSLALPLLSRTPATASAASAASGGATADVCGAHGSGTACASNGGCRTLGTSLALHCPDAASGRLVPQPWFAGWAYQAAFVEKAGRLVRAGNLLRLENALSQAAAESLHAELWSAGGWLRQVRRDPAMQFSRHVLRCDGAIDDGSQSRGASLAAEGGCPPLLQAFHRALREDLQFWSQFAGRPLASWSTVPDHEVSVAATWYRPGDFLSPHNDGQDGRALSFILCLTKNWNESWGGSFWWLRGAPVEYKPAFNSLYLFLPTEDSQHMVSSVVSEPEAGDDLRRLTVSGWFTVPSPELRFPFDML
eukprot:TRINITY_DN18545_c0_g1_i1.p1 TRINITY_DN18545_c0_g1~~TRINITY_DN18545_c0_g1_i1.p1  ORF type:complete len:347 (+),score=53.57 TRINITY_DN18545_c0_g1_i1:62-1042(+)